MYMLAARLHFGLWNTIIDSRCRDIACAGKMPSVRPYPLLPAHTMVSEVEMRGGWDSMVALLSPGNAASSAA
jgi:hypothetical protein